MRIDSFFWLFICFPATSNTLEQAVTQKLHCEISQTLLELVQAWWGLRGITVQGAMEIIRNWDLGQKHQDCMRDKNDKYCLLTLSGPPRPELWHYGMKYYRALMSNRAIKSPHYLSLGYLTCCNTLHRKFLGFSLLLN